LAKARVVSRKPHSVRQTMCLFSILLFLIGYEKPENDDMWKLYLLLHDIIDLQHKHPQNCVYLKAIHHALFRDVFPDRNLAAGKASYFGLLSAGDEKS